MVGTLLSQTSVVQTISGTHITCTHRLLMISTKRQKGEKGRGSSLIHRARLHTRHHVRVRHILAFCYGDIARKRPIALQDSTNFDYSTIPCAFFGFLCHAIMNSMSESVCEKRKLSRA